MGIDFIDIIVGTRPNFVKASPLLNELKARRTEFERPPFRLIHTGQHYDDALNGVFFKELCLPEPFVNFQAGRGGKTVAEQSATIMTCYERLLRDGGMPSACLVFGDVTSSLSAGLTAKRSRVPLIHYEAGIRSGDPFMQEEINRLAIDAISDWYLTVSEHAVETLRQSGANPDRIKQVGNLMADCLLKNLDRLGGADLLGQLDLLETEFALVTLHRPENVDNIDKLRGLLDAIASLELPIVFPVHPRTQHSMRSLRLPETIHQVPPQSYLSFCGLMRAAKLLITDSGGAVEEATVLGTPCLTMRDAHEAKETLDLGTNFLVGSNPEKLKQQALAALKQKCPSKLPQGYDGNAAARIVDFLQRQFPDLGIRARA